MAGPSTKFGGIKGEGGEVARMNAAFAAERAAMNQAPVPGSPRYKAMQGQILQFVMEDLETQEGRTFFATLRKENPAKYAELLKCFIPVMRQSESINANFSAKPDPSAVAADLARRLGAPPADAPAIDVDAVDAGDPCAPPPSQEPARADTADLLAEIYG